MTNDSKPNSALVIGASMAGMAAARVLADHFAEVTIVERDVLPLEPDPRRGVPQSLQAHQLIAEGRRLFELLFPGLDDTLAAAGAPLVDLVNDAHIHFAVGIFPRGPSKAKVRSITRIRLEWEVRRRLTQLSNVRIVQNADVVRLLLDASNERVVGLELEKRLPEGGDVPSRLDADLVVDASGRRSRTPEWLAGLGYPVPEVTNVDGHVSYSTRLYEEIRFPEGTKQLAIFGRVPDVPRIGFAFKVEGERTVVVLGGFGRDHGAPTEESAFLEFARSLIDPIVYEHLRDAKPLGKAQGYRQADNQWRDYAALARLPDRLVPLGDALCAFNPIYGQGMTVACLEAIALGDELRARGLDGIAVRAQRSFKKIVGPAWLFATGEDYRWPTTEGPQAPWLARISHTYIDHVFDLAVRDPRIAATFVEIGQMSRPVSALFAPTILFPVLGRVFTGKTPAMRAQKPATGPQPFQG